MFKKIPTLMVTSAVLTVLLAGCATTTLKPPVSSPEAPTTPTSEGLSPVEVNVEEVIDMNWEGWDSNPSVTDVTENSFVLLHGGSSTCPNIIEEVNYGEVDSTETVEVVYSNEYEGKICTMDFQFSATLIEFKDINLTDLDNVVFQLATVGTDEVTQLKHVTQNSTEKEIKEPVDNEEK